MVTLTSWLFMTCSTGSAKAVPEKTESTLQLSAEHVMTLYELILKSVAERCLSVWLFHKHHDRCPSLDIACQSLLNIGTRKLLSLALNTNARNSSMRTPGWSTYNRIISSSNQWTRFPIEKLACGIWPQSDTSWGCKFTNTGPESHVKCVFSSELVPVGLLGAGP